MTSRNSPAQHVAKKIGELNGPWAILLRLALASYPIVLAWAVWVTVEIFASQAFRNQGNRFTATDAALMRIEISRDSQTTMREISQRLDGIAGRLSNIEGRLAIPRQTP